MNRTIFAYTEFVSPLPGFINIRRDGKGQHIISVRSRGQQYPAELAIAPELLENLAAELMAHLHGEPVAQPEAPAPAVGDDDAKDATRWRTFIGLDYAIRAEWAVNLSLVPVLTQWVDSVAAEEDHDAWQCDRCNGDGWHWVEREGVEWRDKVSTKEHCEQCDGLGWLGPDATKKAKPPVQGSSNG